MSLAQVLIFCFVASTLGCTWIYIWVGWLWTRKFEGFNFIANLIRRFPRPTSFVAWNLKTQIGFLLGQILFVVVFLYTMYKNFDYNLIPGLIVMAITEIISFIIMFQPIFIHMKKKIPLWLNLLLIYIATAIGHIAGYLVINGNVF